MSTELFAVPGGTLSLQKRTVDDAQFEASTTARQKRVKTEFDAEGSHQSLNENDRISSHIFSPKQQPLGIQTNGEDSDMLDRDPMSQWANPQLSFRDLEASKASFHIEEPSVDNPDAFRAWLELRYRPNDAVRGSPLFQYLIEASEESPRWGPRFNQVWGYLTHFLNPSEFCRLTNVRNRVAFQFASDEEPWYPDPRPREDWETKGSSRKEYRPRGSENHPDQQPAQELEQESEAQLEVKPAVQPAPQPATQPAVQPAAQQAVQLAVAVQIEVSREPPQPPIRQKKRKNQRQTRNERKQARKKPHKQKRRQPPNKRHRAPEEPYEQPEYTKRLRSGVGKRSHRPPGHVHLEKAGRLEILVRGCYQL